MATTYVFVPLPAWSCRNGTRMEVSIPRVRGAGLGDGRRTREGVLDGSATLVESEGSLGCSWTETPVSLKLWWAMRFRRRGQSSRYELTYILQNF